MTIKRRKEGNKGNSNMNGFNLPASTNCITKDSNKTMVREWRRSHAHHHTFERASGIKGQWRGNNHQFRTKFRRVRLVAHGRLCFKN